VNLHHLATFVWLRWRLAVNRTRRAGLVSFIVTMILVAFALIGGVAAFGLAFLLGAMFLPRATPFEILMTWDGVVFGFLLFWMTGVIAELQRSELFGIEKFLHLPVTLGGVFVMNYLTSFVSITLIVFVPAMTGLILAFARTLGPMQLVTFVPMTALVFALTAVTYQFRGWIAAMMTNPRRRKLVISLITMVFVLIVQIPNFVNMAIQANSDPTDGAHTKVNLWVEESAGLANALVPIGWLPYAATAATEGRIGPALIASIALSLIGAASLRRSYLTTIRMHTGVYSGTKTAPRPAVRTDRTLLVERSVPGLSEHASAIATTSLRSLLRAPEAKIMLMSPFIMVLVFGAMFLTRTVRPLPELRPVIAFGAMASALLSMGQLVMNPFGFDRAGFRALVMSSADRRDILIGKNLSIAPLVIGLQTVLVTLVQVVLPLRLDHFLALIPQAVTMFLLFCLLANVPAILAPDLPKTAGSGMRQLIRLGFGLALPFVLALALVPYGVEMLLAEVWDRREPYALALSTALAVVTVLFYRVAIGWEAGLLQRRELDILAIVTAKPQ
jgi:ABC-2 type transport system permease protein